MKETVDVTIEAEMARGCAAIAICVVLGTHMGLPAFAEIADPLVISCENGYTQVPITIAEATVQTIGGQARGVVIGSSHARLEIKRWRCLCSMCFNQNDNSIDVTQDTCVVADCVRHLNSTEVVLCMVYWEFLVQVPDNDTLTDATKPGTIDKIYELFDTHQLERTTAIQRLNETLTQDDMELALGRAHVTGDYQGVTGLPNPGTQCVGECVATPGQDWGDSFCWTSTEKNDSPNAWGAPCMRT